MKKTSCLPMAAVPILIIALIVSMLGACSSGGKAPGLPMDRDNEGAPSEDSGYFPQAGENEYMENGESYLEIEQNTEKLTSEESTLTFSLKVDTAAYANVERYINNGERPPADAVRTEELINYFGYDGDMEFKGDEPFSIYTEIGPSPFSENRHMAFIRVKSKDIEKDKLPESNLTFLIDTSGSMESYDKLELLKDAFNMLVETLSENDRISIVTYAGSSGVILDSVSGADKKKILDAIYNLSAGGSTAGANGIITAYELAEKNYAPDRNNRVILATDGDFNVGISDVNELSRLISQKRESGVYLSVLGFGTGNIRDDIMETLAKNGNGNYSYINSQRTANKVLVEELASNIFVIADDVKAQIEFNPDNVLSYRLIGYENRKLENRDFNDDTKDAGEIGIGTDVIVMFEIELKSSGSGEGLKYTDTGSAQNGAGAEFKDELFEVRLRYKNPNENESRLMTRPVKFSDMPLKNSADFDFACCVASFCELLRNSRYSENVNIEDILFITKNSLGNDKGGYRSGFVEMLYSYEKIK